MLITRRSQYSGLEHTFDVPVTLEQIQAWKGGKMIQEAMPDISPDMREFIMTGITPDEWDEIMANNEEIGAEAKSRTVVACLANQKFRHLHYPGDLQNAVLSIEPWDGDHLSLKVHINASGDFAAVKLTHDQARELAIGIVNTLLFVEGQEDEEQPT